MLSSVEVSPIYLPRISLGKKCKLAIYLKKLENLSVRSGIPLPMSRADPLNCTVDPVTTNTKTYLDGVCGIKKPWLGLRRVILLKMDID